jgi:hypothetical protein
MIWQRSKRSLFRQFFQRARNNTPSPQVEGKERPRAVHGHSARCCNVGALHELSSSTHWAQPFQGCGHSMPQSQGSSFLATLGFEAESLWDSRFEDAPGFSTCAKQKEAPDD